jgi:hypothetical protein
VSQHPSSMVVTRIGGRDYPLRSVPTCFTCQNVNRITIENDLIKGYSYTVIARGLADTPVGRMPHPTARQISDHVKNGHLPIGVSSQRRLIERRAQEIGKSIEDSEDTLVDYLTVNQMIVQRGFERMQDAEIEPDMADLIAASRFLYQVEQSAGGGLDENTWRDALMAYMETTREFIPQERWAEYGAAMNANPILKAMAKAAEQKAIGGAEAVD